MSTVVCLGYMRNRLAFRVTNSGGTDLRVTEYYIEFPSENVKLLEVNLPPYYDWQGEKTSPATISGPESNQVLKAGTSGILYHVFEHVIPTISGYYAKITFSGGSYAELTIP